MKFRLLRLGNTPAGLKAVEGKPAEEILSW